MPESKVRKEAKSKERKKQTEKPAEAPKKRKEREKLAEARKKRKERKRLAAKAERRWVPWVFIPVGLLGVLWMVTWNLAGSSIDFMRALRDWNILIALGLIIASFSLMTLWK